LGFQFPKWKSIWECVGSFPHKFSHFQECECDSWIVILACTFPCFHIGCKPKAKVVTHMESQWLINTTNFIKIKNHFNHFFSEFSFFNTQWCTLFCHKYILEPHNINWKKEFYLQLNYVIIYHSMQKVWKNMFQYYHGWSSNMNTPKKQYNVTTSPPLPPLKCFHPIPLCVF